MIVVVDVNPIISALIKNSFIRTIIVSANFDFCFPEPALQKIRKYQNYIIDKSGLSELEYLVILYTLLRFIRIIPMEEILQYWDDAKKIIGHIDPEDVAFIATALGQEEAIIWSDDAHFKKQDKMKILTTKDIAKLVSSTN